MGGNPSLEAVTKVFESVVSENKATFDIFQGSLGEQFDFPVEPERVFVPGNHDRLVNLYPTLRVRAREVFGIPPSDAPFDHTFLDLDYGVYARHGQEWDPFNFEESDAFSIRDHVQIPFEDYMKIPIGDLLASEMASKLPLKVLEVMPEDHPDRIGLYHKFQNLFDVRPMMSLIHWLGYHTDRFDEDVKAMLNEAMRGAADDFESVPFVKGWFDKHDRMSNPFDRADRLQILMKALQVLKFTKFDRSLKGIDQAELKQEVAFGQKAVEEFRRLDRDVETAGRVLYVVYGHTHAADVRPVGFVGDPPNDHERIYINTGTWRPVHRQGDAGDDWLSWKSLTYTIFYREGEHAGSQLVKGAPAFEAWTGTINDLSTHEIG